MFGKAGSCIRSQASQLLSSSRFISYFDTVGNTTRISLKISKKDILDILNVKY